MTPISGLTMTKIVMEGLVTSKTNAQKATVTLAAIGLEIVTVVGPAPISRR